VEKKVKEHSRIQIHCLVPHDLEFFRPSISKEKERHTREGEKAGAGDRHGRGVRNILSEDSYSLKVKSTHPRQQLNFIVRKDSRSSSKWKKRPRKKGGGKAKTVYRRVKFNMGTSRKGQ